ncbi:Cyclin-dependent kinase F-4, partial [Linum perenne]
RRRKTNNLLRIRATRQFSSAVEVFCLKESLPDLGDDEVGKSPQAMTRSSAMTSLCMWDPAKRPTASEVLQHSFFQSCFYVPPSLRSRPSVTRTPPSAITKGLMEQQCARRYSSTLPSSKVFHNPAAGKLHASLSTGVQRKLDLVNQDENKDDKTPKNTARQQKYRPPARKSPTSTMRGRATSGNSDMADKFGSMNIGSRKPTIGPTTASSTKAPSMKTGVQWNAASSDSFLRTS